MSISHQQSRPTAGSEDHKPSLWKKLSPQSVRSRKQLTISHLPMAPRLSRSSVRDTRRSLRHKRSVMQWLQQDCPQDLLPKILAFCGPQQTSVLGQTNRFWRDVVKEEATWRTLCEDLYKVSFPLVASYYYTIIVAACVWLDLTWFPVERGRRRTNLLATLLPNASLRSRRLLDHWSRLCSSSLVRKWSTTVHLHLDSPGKVSCPSGHYHSEPTRRANRNEDYGNATFVLSRRPRPWGASTRSKTKG